MPRLSASAALLTLLAPAAGFCAEESITPRQQSYLSSPAHQRESAEKLKAAAPVVFPGCANLNVSPDKYAVLRAIEFDDKGNPRVGFWKESYNAEGCGKARKLTLFWSTDAKGDLYANLGMPGETLTDPTAQNIAMKQAIQAAAKKYPECKTAAIDDTRFDMALMIPPKPPAPPVDNAWQETWMVALCGHVVDVPLTFAQSGANLEIAVQAGGVVDHK